MFKKIASISSLGSDPGTGLLRAARAGNLEKVLEYLKANVDINTCNANGLNALHLASKDGHVNVVQELLERGANVDAATKKGNTALHIAALAGQEEVVKLLVQHGANVNVQSAGFFTPCYMAAQENHDGVVRYLLAHGANQSLATEDGFTPLAVAMQQGHDKVVAILLESDVRGKVRLPALHIAAKKDDCKAASLLLQNSANPDVTSKSNFTPLHIAAHYGNHGVAALLLDRGADVNFPAKHQITPLHVASKWGKAQLAALLLERGANIEAKTRDQLTPLHCAARSGHEQLVDLLLEKGAPISAKTKVSLSPLHMSAQGDHVDAARILLYHKAPVDDVTIDYLTALHVASHCGHVRVAKLLLDRKADPNARALNGFTPLHIACKKNRIKVVELLLKNGAHIESTTESGLTPLHVASFMGCMNIAIFLLQNGAKPDAATVRGETPLHLAARANQTDIVRILLRNGATVDARAREEQTPLHIAARLGNCDLVMLLLQHGAAVDAATKEHYTALSIAAKEGQEEVASILLDKGADVGAVTKRKFTPLHLAAKYGHLKTANLLISKGAPVNAEGKNNLTPLHMATHHDRNQVALMLLNNDADPKCAAKNLYTPLHIAAKKNQIDIATALLEYGADVNAESRAGFTPIHLAAQEGNADMVTLLIQHGADADAGAKTGLRPLHLAAQEDRVQAANVLVNNGSAHVDSQTSTGYTPLHVASHFGQAAMVRYLLQQGADVHSTTSAGNSPLHHAAQQGQTLIITLLLEKKASPDAVNNAGQTPLAIAEKLGYVSVVETLKIVTTTITTTTTTTTMIEERYKVLAPETMAEALASDSEDEGTEDAGNESYRYLTVDDMKSLGDDSLPIDVTRDEQHHRDSGYINTEENVISHKYSQLASDNIDISRSPVQIGFLVSFMVDARGGAMRGCRHSGVRVIIPPRKAPSPMRITCRYLKKDRLVHPPPLMEGEALASRILELGPAGAKFLGPVILEVPHFASLRGHEREIVVLRSDNGETWREHNLDATEEAVQDVLNESFDTTDLKQLEDLKTNRITRILTTDFPQYFALVSRIRQEVHAVGPDGGMVSSSVVPQVQAVFPCGALTKRIKVGLQAQPIPSELINKVAGSRVSVSPIVTVEPRRRKFHKPITLTIPVPKSQDPNSSLRLLCSITGGTTRAQWEDVTGSTPLTFVDDCVSFTTTVSARFWLVDCRHASHDVTRMATDLYREAIHVPFMAKFVIFSKRIEPTEARLRVFCMTDDREEKTLEGQENFTEVAKSRDVEVLEGKPQWIELAGNLAPVTKSGEQLRLKFYAFKENRLPFLVRLRDANADPVGRIIFMRESKSSGKTEQVPVCNLNIVLPDQILPDEPSAPPSMSSSPRLPLHTNRYNIRNAAYSTTPKQSLLTVGPGEIHKADLKISDVANLLGNDWVPLARYLGIADPDVAIIEAEYPQSPHQQATVMLRLWMQQAGDRATGNSLEKALNSIGRDDIVSKCIGNVAPVTDASEKIIAQTHVDQAIKALESQIIQPALIKHEKRNLSLDVSYDEQDLMKDSESLEELSQTESFKVKSQRIRSQSPTDENVFDASKNSMMTSSYEREEQKYVAEEKICSQKVHWDGPGDGNQQPKSVDRSKSEDSVGTPEKTKTEREEGMTETESQSYLYDTGISMTLTKDKDPNVGMMSDTEGEVSDFSLTSPKKDSTRLMSSRSVDDISGADDLLRTGDESFEESTYVIPSPPESSITITADEPRIEIELDLEHIITESVPGAVPILVDKASSPVAVGTPERPDSISRSQQISFEAVDVGVGTSPKEYACKDVLTQLHDIVTVPMKDEEIYKTLKEDQEARLSIETDSKTTQATKVARSTVIDVPEPKDKPSDRSPPSVTKTTRVSERERIRSSSMDDNDDDMQFDLSIEDEPSALGIPTFGITGVADVGKQADDAVFRISAAAAAAAASSSTDEIKSRSKVPVITHHQGQEKATRAAQVPETELTGISEGSLKKDPVILSKTESEETETVVTHKYDQQERPAKDTPSAPVIPQGATSPPNKSKLEEEEQGQGSDDFWDFSDLKTEEKPQVKSQIATIIESPDSEKKDLIPEKPFRIKKHSDGKVEPSVVCTSTKFKVETVREIVVESSSHESQQTSEEAEKKIFQITQLESTATTTTAVESAAAATTTTTTTTTTTSSLDHVDTLTSEPTSRADAFLQIERQDVSPDASSDEKSEETVKSAELIDGPQVESTTTSSLTHLDRQLTAKERVTDLEELVELKSSPSPQVPLDEFTLTADQKRDRQGSLESEGVIEFIPDQERQSSEKSVIESKTSDKITVASQVHTDTKEKSAGEKPGDVADGTGVDTKYAAPSGTATTVVSSIKSKEQLDTVKTIGSTVESLIEKVEDSQHITIHELVSVKEIAHPGKAKDDAPAKVTRETTEDENKALVEDKSEKVVTLEFGKIESDGSGKSAAQLPANVTQKDISVTQVDESMGGKHAKEIKILGIDAKKPTQLADAKPESIMSVDSAMLRESKETPELLTGDTTVKQSAFVKVETTLVKETTDLRTKQEFLPEPLLVTDHEKIVTSLPEQVPPSDGEASVTQSDNFIQSVSEKEVRFGSSESQREHSKTPDIELSEESKLHAFQQTYQATIVKEKLEETEKMFQSVMESLDVAKKTSFEHPVEETVETQSLLKSPVDISSQFELDEHFSILPQPSPISKNEDQSREEFGEFIPTAVFGGPLASAAMELQEKVFYKHLDLQAELAAKEITPMSFEEDEASKILSALEESSELTSQTSTTGDIQFIARKPIQVEQLSPLEQALRGGEAILESITTEKPLATTILPLRPKSLEESVSQPFESTLSEFPVGPSRAPEKVAPVLEKLTETELEIARKSPQQVQKESDINVSVDTFTESSGKDIPKASQEFSPSHPFKSALPFETTAEDDGLRKETLTGAKMVPSIIPTHENIQLAEKVDTSLKDVSKVVSTAQVQVETEYSEKQLFKARVDKDLQHMELESVRDVLSGDITGAKGLATEKTEILGKTTQPEPLLQVTSLLECTTSLLEESESGDTFKLLETTTQSDETVHVKKVGGLSKHMEKHFMPDVKGKTEEERVQQRVQEKVEHLEPLAAEIVTTIENVSKSKLDSLRSEHGEKKESQTIDTKEGVKSGEDVLKDVQSLSRQAFQKSQEIILDPKMLGEQTKRIDSKASAEIMAKEESRSRTSDFKSKGIEEVKGAVGYIPDAVSGFKSVGEIKTDKIFKESAETMTVEEIKTTSKPKTISTEIVTKSADSETFEDIPKLGYTPEAVSGFMSVGEVKTDKIFKESAETMTVEEIKTISKPETISTEIVTKSEDSVTKIISDLSETIKTSEQVVTDKVKISKETFEDIPKTIDAGLLSKVTSDSGKTESSFITKKSEKYLMETTELSSKEELDSRIKTEKHSSETVRAISEILPTASSKVEKAVLEVESDKDIALSVEKGIIDTTSKVDTILKKDTSVIKIPDSTGYSHTEILTEKSAQLATEKIASISTELGRVTEKSEKVFSQEIEKRVDESVKSEIQLSEAKAESKKESTKIAEISTKQELIFDKMDKSKPTEEEMEEIEALNRLIARKIRLPGSSAIETFQQKLETTETTSVTSELLEKSRETTDMDPTATLIQQLTKKDEEAKIDKAARKTPGIFEKLESEKDMIMKESQEILTSKIESSSEQLSASKEKVVKAVEEKVKIRKDSLTSTTSNLEALLGESKKIDIGVEKSKEKIQVSTVIEEPRGDVKPMVSRVDDLLSKHIESAQGAMKLATEELKTQFESEQQIVTETSKISASMTEKIEKMTAPERTHGALTTDPKKDAKVEFESIDVESKSVRAAAVVATKPDESPEILGKSVDKSGNLQESFESLKMSARESATKITEIAGAAALGVGLLLSSLRPEEIETKAPEKPSQEQLISREIDFQNVVKTEISTSDMSLLKSGKEIQASTDIVTTEKIDKTLLVSFDLPQADVTALTELKTPESTEEISVSKSIVTKVAELPTSDLKSAFDLPQTDLTKLVELPTPDSTEAASLTKSVAMKVVELPVSDVTKSIDLPEADVTTMAELQAIESTEGISLSKTDVIQVVDLPAKDSTDSAVDILQADLTKLVEASTPDSIQAVDLTIAEVSKVVEVPTSDATLSVDQHKTDVSKVVELTISDALQSIDLPKEDVVKVAVLSEADSTQVPSIPPADLIKLVELPAQDSKQEVGLPKADGIHVVELLTLDDTQSVDVLTGDDGVQALPISDLTKAFDLHDADITPSDSKAAFDLPKSDVTKDVELPILDSTKVLDLPKADTTKVVELLISDTREIDLHKADVTSKVEISTSDSKAAVDLSKSDVTKEVEVSIVDSTEAIRLHKGDAEKFVELTASDSKQLVDISQVVTKAVQISTSDSTASVDLSKEDVTKVTDTLKTIELPTSDSKQAIDLHKSDATTVIELPTSESKQALDPTQTDTTKALELPATDPTLAVDISQADLTKLAESLTHDSMEAVVIPKADVTKVVELPTSDATQAIDLLVADVTPRDEILTSDSTATVDLSKSDVTKVVELPTSEITQSVDLTKADVVKVAVLSAADSTQIASLPPADLTKLVELPTSEITQSVDLHKTDVEKVVEFPTSDSKQAVDLPKVDTTKVVELEISDDTQSVDLPKADKAKVVELPTSESKEEVDLPQTDMTKVVELPTSEITQSVDLAKAEVTKVVELPTSGSKHAVDLPKADTIKVAELPVSDATQSVDLPKANVTKVVELPISESKQAVDLPQTDTTKVVELPTSEISQPVDLPKADTIKVVELEISDDTQLVDLPKADVTKVVELPTSDSKQEVDLPKADVTKVVDLPTSDSKQTVDLPKADIIKVAELPVSDVTQSVDLPKADETKVVKLLTSDSKQAIDVHKADATKVVELPVSEFTQVVDITKGDTTKVEYPISDYPQAGDLLLPVAAEVVELPISDSTQIIDLPQIDTTKAIELPASDSKQAIDLNKSDVMKAVDLTTSDSTQVVDIPQEVVTKFVELPTREATLAAGLPEEDVTNLVEVTSSDTIQAADRPSLDMTKVVEVSTSGSTEAVDLSKADVATRDDLPIADSTYSETTEVETAKDYKGQVVDKREFSKLEESKTVDTVVSSDKQITVLSDDNIFDEVSETVVKSIEAGSVLSEREGGKSGETVRIRKEGRPKPTFLFSEPSEELDLDEEIAVTAATEFKDLTDKDTTEKEPTVEMVLTSTDDQVLDKVENQQSEKIQEKEIGKFQKSETTDVSSEETSTTTLIMTGTMPEPAADIPAHETLPEISEIKTIMGKSEIQTAISKPKMEQELAKASSSEQTDVDGTSAPVFVEAVIPDSTDQISLTASSEKVVAEVSKLHLTEDIMKSGDKEIADQLISGETILSTEITGISLHKAETVRPAEVSAVLEESLQKQIDLEFSPSAPCQEQATSSESLDNLLSLTCESPLEQILNLESSLPSALGSSAKSSAGEEMVVTSQFTHEKSMESEVEKTQKTELATSEEEIISLAFSAASMPFTQDGAESAESFKPVETISGRSEIAEESIPPTVYRSEFVKELEVVVETKHGVGMSELEKFTQESVSTTAKHADDSEVLGPSPDLEKLKEVMKDSADTSYRAVESVLKSETRTATKEISEKFETSFDLLQSGKVTGESTAISETFTEKKSTKYDTKLETPEEIKESMTSTILPIIDREAPCVPISEKSAVEADISKPKVKIPEEPKEQSTTSTKQPDQEEVAQKGNVPSEKDVHEFEQLETIIETKELQKHLQTDLSQLEKVKAEVCTASEASVEKIDSKLDGQTLPHTPEDTSKTLQSETTITREIETLAKEELVGKVEKAQVGEQREEKVMVTSSTGDDEDLDEFRELESLIFTSASRLDERGIMEQSLPPEFFDVESEISDKRAASIPGSSQQGPLQLQPEVKITMSTKSETVVSHEEIIQPAKLITKTEYSCFDQTKREKAIDDRPLEQVVCSLEEDIIAFTEASKTDAVNTKGKKGERIESEIEATVHSAAAWVTVDKDIFPDIPEKLVCLTGEEKAEALSKILDTIDSDATVSEKKSVGKDADEDTKGVEELFIVPVVLDAKTPEDVRKSYECKHVDEKEEKLTALEEKAIEIERELQKLIANTADTTEKTYANFADIHGLTTKDSEEEVAGFEDWEERKETDDSITSKSTDLRTSEGDSFDFTDSNDKTREESVYKLSEGEIVVPTKTLEQEEKFESQILKTQETTSKDIVKPEDLPWAAETVAEREVKSPVEGESRIPVPVRGKVKSPEKSPYREIVRSSRKSESPESLATEKILSESQSGKMSPKTGKGYSKIKSEKKEVESGSGMTSPEHKDKSKSPEPFKLESKIPVPIRGEPKSPEQRRSKTSSPTSPKAKPLSFPECLSPKESSELSSPGTPKSESKIPVPIRSETKSPQLGRSGGRTPQTPSPTMKRTFALEQSGYSRSKSSTPESERSMTLPDTESYLPSLEFQGMSGSVYFPEQEKVGETSLKSGTQVKKETKVEQGSLPSQSKKEAPTAEELITAVEKIKTTSKTLESPDTATSKSDSPALAELISPSQMQSPGTTEYSSAKSRSPLADESSSGVTASPGLDEYFLKGGSPYMSPQGSSPVPGTMEQSTLKEQSPTPSSSSPIFVETMEGSGDSLDQQMSGEVISQVSAVASESTAEPGVAMEIKHTSSDISSSRSTSEIQKASSMATTVAFETIESIEDVDELQPPDLTDLQAQAAQSVKEQKKLSLEQIGKDESDEMREALRGDSVTLEAQISATSSLESVRDRGLSFSSSSSVVTVIEHLSDTGSLSSLMEDAPSEDAIFESKSKSEPDLREHGPDQSIQELSESIIEPVIKIKKPEAPELEIPKHKESDLSVTLSSKEEISTREKVERKKPGPLLSDVDMLVEEAREAASQLKREVKMLRPDLTPTPTDQAMTPVLKAMLGLLDVDDDKLETVIEEDKISDTVSPKKALSTESVDKKGIEPSPVDPFTNEYISVVEQEINIDQTILARDVLEIVGEIKSSQESSSTLSEQGVIQTQNLTSKLINFGTDSSKPKDRASAAQVSERLERSKGPEEEKAEKGLTEVSEKMVKETTKGKPSLTFRKQVEFQEYIRSEVSQEPTSPPTMTKFKVVTPVRTPTGEELVTQEEELVHEIKVSFEPCKSEKRPRISPVLERRFPLEKIGKEVKDVDFKEIDTKQGQEGMDEGVEVLEPVTKVVRVTASNVSPSSEIRTSVVKDASFSDTPTPNMTFAPEVVQVPQHIQADVFEASLEQPELGRGVVQVRSNLKLQSFEDIRTEQFTTGKHQQHVSVELIERHEHHPEVEFEPPRRVSESNLDLESGQPKRPFGPTKLMGKKHRSVYSMPDLEYQIQYPVIPRPQSAPAAIITSEVFVKTLDFIYSQRGERHESAFPLTSPDGRNIFFSSSTESSSYPGNVAFDRTNISVGSGDRSASTSPGLLSCTSPSGSSSSARGSNLPAIPEPEHSQDSSTSQGYSASPQDLVFTGNQSPGTSDSSTKYSSPSNVDSPRMTCVPTDGVGSPVKSKSKGSSSSSPYITARVSPTTTSSAGGSGTSQTSSATQSTSQASSGVTSSGHYSSGSSTSSSRSPALISNVSMESGGSKRSSRSTSDASSKSSYTSKKSKSESPKTSSSVSADEAVIVRSFSGSGSETQSRSSCASSPISISTESQTSESTELQVTRLSPPIRETPGQFQYPTVVESLSPFIEFSFAVKGNFHH
ncbi:unnamed protein product [Allacma fusca]|uniref:Ankyrin-2 n=1 Tax=Allacma fusca TaxID=39272 RepID=A0A8J2JEW2_9HEXA|nr:unnamed protein product [Allacma fusca]